MNFLYNIYFLIPGFSKFRFISKALNKVLSFILKRIFDAFLPKYLKKSSNKAGFGLNKEKRDESYIVSLTSFPARINEVWITIETLLRQSFKPDKIILWLAEDQFPEHKIPESLEKLIERGLTIEFCDEDLRSHKKYFYALKNYPEACIITADDDLYYDNNFIKNLILLHHQHPNLIVTNRAHRFTFDNDNGILPYKYWKHNVTDLLPSFYLVPTGGAGTLYPPGSLNVEVLNKEVFKKICFYADDLWLKAMSLLNKTNIATNSRYNKDFITIGGSQKEKLVNKNVLNGGNDYQFKSVLEHYSIILKNLSER